MTKLLRRLPKQEKHNQGSYDGLRCPHEWPDVFRYVYDDLTITLKFEDFLNRVSIWGQFRDGVRPVLGSLDPEPLDPTWAPSVLPPHSTVWLVYWLAFGVLHP